MTPVRLLAAVLAAGAVAFLRKPFNDELFIKTLREAIKRGAIRN